MSQISSKTSNVKKTAQKDAIKDITSDSQVNSYFPYRWSPASLIFNIYFYLYLYLKIKGTTIKSGTPYLKSPKNQNRRAALGRPTIKFLILTCTIYCDSHFAHVQSHLQLGQYHNSVTISKQQACS